MLRNFGILKMRLFFPTLADQYKIGPREVSLIAQAISRAGMKLRSNNITDMRMSVNLFI